jgi:predicted DNA-binding protein (UPF0251 family)
MKKRGPAKKATGVVSKEKKVASQTAISDEEIREMESLELSEKVKDEGCQEVAKHMGISRKEVKRLMEKLDSGNLSRELKKQNCRILKTKIRQWLQ